jgi:hypothetical protein
MKTAKGRCHLIKYQTGKKACQGGLEVKHHQIFAGPQLYTRPKDLEIGLEVCDVR